VLTLGALGPRAMLGVNISSPAIQLDRLLDLVERHGLKPALRLGLAHPSLSALNRFLHPKQYPLIGAIVESFAEKAAGRGVWLDFDCGFVPCMFREGLKERLPQLFEQVGRRCNPIPDLLPDGRFVSCFPLAALGSVGIDQVPDAQQAQSHFTNLLASLGGVGIYSACSVCEHFRERSCRGGCRAATFARLRSSRVTEPEAASEGGPAHEPKARRIWVVPYIDQPLDFWRQLRDDFGDRISEVYFPLPGGLIGSGRPPQPDRNLESFLRDARLPAGVLVNPIVLPKPLEVLLEPIVDALRRLRDDYAVRAVTVTNPTLASRIREALPDVTITASTLMDIGTPAQAALIEGVIDRLVPASRVMRDLPALQKLREAFPGRVRLIVNEGCLPGCPLRVQHFAEMASLDNPAPESLCGQLLERRPWLRLTSSWVLPQHLRFYDGLFDELKLAGRVTLRNPRHYRSVLTSYVYGLPLGPHEIGAGPASVIRPMEIDEEFFQTTLSCDRQCGACAVCREYWMGHSELV